MKNKNSNSTNQRGSRAISQKAVTKKSVSRKPLGLEPSALASLPFAVGLRRESARDGFAALINVRRCLSWKGFVLRTCVPKALFEKNLKRSCICDLNR